MLIELLTLLLFTSAFLFSYNFSKADSLYEDIDGDGYIIWHKDDDLSINSEVYIDPGMTLIIEKGAEVRLGQYSYISVSGGRIIANGTNDEPIKITSASPNTSHLIEFYYGKQDGIPEAEPSFLRYVEFSKGGYGEPQCPDCSAFLQYIFPRANAFSGGTPALYFGGGKFHIENCSFNDIVCSDFQICCRPFLFCSGKATRLRKSFCRHNEIFCNFRLYYFFGSNSLSRYFQIFYSLFPFFSRR